MGTLLSRLVLMQASSQVFIRMTVPTDQALSKATRLALWLLAPRLLLRLLIRHTCALALLYGLYFGYKVTWDSVKLSLRAIRRHISVLFGTGVYARVCELKAEMQMASSFKEWKSLANEADLLEGRLEWKDRDESEHYDYERIRSSTSVLKTLLDQGDIEGLMKHLRSRLFRDLTGIGRRPLYSCLRAGSKRLIETYNATVVQALEAVAEQNSSRIPPLRKLAFFNETRHSYGRSALLLSGGGTLGLYHAGVIEALVKVDMLPRIVSGASVGSIFASIVGTHTDSELLEISRTKTLSLDAFPPSGGNWRRRLKNFLCYGYVYDVNTLKECIRKNVGEYTFSEAYARTGRVTNIVVAPIDMKKGHTRLLNYLTAPDVLIWSATVASCAIPGVFEAVELMTKGRDGTVLPYYNDVVKWSDGSLSADLPMRRLAELFNVNHFVVSQVNPHVLPLVRPFMRIRHTNSWFAGLITYLGTELRELLLNVLGTGLGSVGWVQVLRRIIEQEYYGDITLFPVPAWSDFLNILSNPTREMFDRCARTAVQYTWRHMALIQGHCQIEFALDACTRQVRAELALQQGVGENVDYRSPSSLLSSRIRSWSAEQFNLFQKTEQENRHEGEPMLLPRSASVFGLQEKTESNKYQIRSKTRLVDSACAEKGVETSPHEGDDEIYPVSEDTADAELVTENSMLKTLKAVEDGEQQRTMMMAVELADLDLMPLP